MRLLKTKGAGLIADLTFYMFISTTPSDYTSVEKETTVRLVSVLKILPFDCVRFDAWGSQFLYFFFHCSKKKNISKVCQPALFLSVSHQNKWTNESPANLKQQVTKIWLKKTFFCFFFNLNYDLLQNNQISKWQLNWKNIFEFEKKTLIAKTVIVWLKWEEVFQFLISLWNI